MFLPFESGRVTIFAERKISVTRLRCLLQEMRTFSGDL